MTNDLLFRISFENLRTGLHTHLGCGNTNQCLSPQLLRTSLLAKRMGLPWEDETVKNAFNLLPDMVCGHQTGAGSNLQVLLLSLHKGISCSTLSRGVKHTPAVSCQIFCKYHSIYAHVQSCILFWGCWSFSVIRWWQIWYYSLSLQWVYAEPFPASWSFSIRWYSAQSVIETGHGCTRRRQTSANETGRDRQRYLIYK